MDQVDLRVALGRAGGRVDMVAAEEGAVLKGLRDWEGGKVLVAEGHDLALGHEVGKLRLAGVRELAYLHAADLGANSGSNFCHGGGRAENVGVGCVGIVARIAVFEGREGRVLLLWVPGGKIIGVLVREEG